MSILRRVEIVLVAFRSGQMLRSLLPTLPDEVAVTVVDNSVEQEDLTGFIDEMDRIRYVRAPKNLGFAGGANLGARGAERPLLIFLNPDARPERDVLEKLALNLEGDSTCAACGPALVDERGRIQAGGGGWEPTVPRVLIYALGLHLVFRSGGIWVVPRRGEVLELEWLAGTCLAVRRDRFLEVGGFDEDYFLYQEDMALGRRLKRLGYRLLMRADLQVKHLGGASTLMEHREVWRLRAEAMAQYLVGHGTRPQGRLMRGILSVGFALRAVAYAVFGRRTRAVEMGVYARRLWG